MAKHDWLYEGAAWCEIADPHGVDGLPIYLLDHVDVAEVLQFKNTTAATSAMLCLLLRDRIPNWRGPGFCAVIDLAAHATMRSVVGIVLHEYAHWLDIAADYEQPLPVVLDKYLDRAPVTAERPLTAGLVSLEGTTERPWRHHGPRFIRACCHLAHRAQRSDWLGDADYVFWGDPYWLSQATSYAARLGDETERLIDTPLLDVLRQPMPESFAAFAADDLRRAEKRYQFLKSLRPASPAAVADDQSRRTFPKENAMEILDKIRQTYIRRKARKFSDFNALVDTIAGGKEPEPEVVEQVLESTGRDIDDLEAAVSTRQTRRRLQAELTELDSLPGEIESLTAEIRKHDADLDAARHRHNKATAPLYQQREQLQNRFVGRNGIRQQLIRSAPSEYEARLAALADDARPIAHKLQWIHETVGSVQSGADRRELDRQKADLDKQMADINQRRDALTADMLTA